MARFAALIALGLSATSAVVLEPSFAPFPEVSPDVAVDLIPTASLEPLAFHSNVLGVTPEPVEFPTLTTEPVTDPLPGVSPEPGATLPHASSEPGRDSPFVSAEPVVTPDPFSQAFTFNVQGSPEPTVVPNTGAAVAANPAAKKSVNEGCVAIEHLNGYVLQHRRHLTRDVLCANGFCATPNHAIIVDGEYTSMKQLCAGQWKCTESVKLVNNLKVWANRRAVVDGGIIVTPYDVRFPKAASWIAQIAEEIYHFISISTVVAFISAALAVVFGSSKKSKLQ